MNTKKGGQKVKLKLLEKLGSEEALHNWYVELGRKGGKAGNTGGFAANPALASRAGKIGGVNSWAKLTPEERTLRAQKIWDKVNKKKML